MTVADPWAAFAESALKSPALVSNARVQLHLDSLAGACLPVTVSKGPPAETSWIFSLANAYGPYARAELESQSMPAAARWCLAGASHLAQGALAAAGLHKSVILNSWQVSTDLLAPHWTAIGLSTSAQKWAAREPEAPVVLRSLTPALHGSLLADLQHRGWRLLPTRQVWLTDDLSNERWLRHRDVRKDLALEANASGLLWSNSKDEVWTDGDYRRVQVLYRQLYLEKYPKHNPGYTADFFKLGSLAGWLQLQGLRQAHTGQLVAVIGSIQRGDWLATPVLGYDLSAPVDWGLYRRLMLRAWQTAQHSRARMHCSAGAGLFKRNRGASPHWELSAIWGEHLSGIRRKALVGLESLLVDHALPKLEGRVL